MKTKFPLTTTRKDTTSTDAIVEKSTPLMHALGELIMSKYDGPDAELSEQEIAIDKLFSRWSPNATTHQLAELTEVLTGYKPNAIPTADIGSLFKANTAQGTGTKACVVVGISGTTRYGVTVAGSEYCSFNVGAGYTTPPRLTEGEAGLFAKEFLKNVKGGALISYISSSIGGNTVANLLKEVGLAELL